MLSRTKSAFCMVLALSVVAFTCPITWSQDINWAPDVTAARRASVEYKVPVLIHFYGDNCLPCKLLEQNVLNRTEVVDTLNKYFICVKVNASQERSTAAQYGVHSWPTDVFISPDGKTLDQGTCKQSATAYLSVLHGIAVMNRDRNIMLAAEQSDRANQVTSQNNNYAQPATAAPSAVPAAMAGTAGSMASGPATGSTQVTGTNAPGLPTAGQVLAGNPQGPNFYAEGSGTGMQQLPNSLAPNASVASGPLLSQNQPHAVTTAVQAAGNQIAPATGPHTLNTNDGHLPPMEFAGQVTGTQSGRATDPLAAVAATAPTVPAAPVVATQTLNAWNQPQTTRVAVNQGQTLNNPHFNPTPTTSQVAAGQTEQAPLGHMPMANMQSVAPALPNMAVPALPNATAPGLPNIATAQPADGGPKISASTVSFQPRNALSIEANTLGAQTQATPAQAEMASVALEGFCPVALKAQGSWVPGLPQYAVKHRGRVYHLSSPEAMREFLRAPDSSSPVMSGYDAMIFLSEGKLVEGSIQHGLHEQVSGSILLFASAESKQAYEQNFDRNTQALKIVLQKAGVNQ